ncbi:MAG: hypothetical protein JO266_08030 [Acidobacteria bacterium]|nr:hypothetical protein [Acidobacteriota bacterium]
MVQPTTALYDPYPLIAARREKATAKGIQVGWRARMQAGDSQFEPGPDLKAAYCLSNRRRWRN